MYKSVFIYFRAFYIKHGTTFFSLHVSTRNTTSYGTIGAGAEDLRRFWRRSHPNTVCPGSSDPSEKIFNTFASENEVLHHLLTITILLVEYYSFTEQNNFRSHELNWIT